MPALVAVGSLISTAVTEGGAAVRRRSTIFAFCGIPIAGLGSSLETGPAMHSSTAAIGVDRNVRQCGQGVSAERDTRVQSGVPRGPGLRRRVERRRTYRGYITHPRIGALT